MPSSRSRACLAGPPLLAAALLLPHATGAEEGPPMVTALILGTEETQTAAVAEAVRSRLERLGIEAEVASREGGRVAVLFQDESRSAAIRQALRADPSIALHEVSDLVAGPCPANDPSAFCVSGGGEKGRVYRLEPEPLHVIDRTASAEAVESATGQADLHITLEPADSRRFCEITAERIGTQIALVAEERVLIAPRVRDAICGGQISITGGAGGVDLAALADRLSLVPMPAAVEFLSVERVEAPKGAWRDAIDRLWEAAPEAD